MLKQRVITALILAIVIVSTILFADSSWVAVLFALVLFGATLELLALTTKPVRPLSIGIAILFAFGFWIVSHEAGIRINFYQSFAGLMIWVAISGFLLLYQFSGHWSLVKRWFHLILGCLALWICVHALVFVHRHFDQGGWILLYLLTLVWVADVGAYFSGRRFGKHKLAPGISPGKTWEGVFGGLVCNLVWMLIVYQLSHGWGLELWQFIFIGLVTSAMSVAGDLYQSILKREAGVKDSGKLLPGHGGVLDRIDSVIAAAPVYVSGLYLVGAV